MKLCEMLVDRYITSIKREQQHLSNVGLTLSSRTKSNFEKRRKLTFKEKQYALAWMSFLEKSSIFNLISSFSPNEPPTQYVSDMKLILLRYWLLKGKLALCEGNIENAFQWYGKSKELLETESMVHIEVNLHW